MKMVETCSNVSFYIQINKVIWSEALLNFEVLSGR